MEEKISSYTVDPHFSNIVKCNRCNKKFNIANFQGHERWELEIMNAKDEVIAKGSTFVNINQNNNGEIVDNIQIEMKEHNSNHGREMVSNRNERVIAVDNLGEDKSFKSKEKYQYL